MPDQHIMGFHPFDWRLFHRPREATFPLLVQRINMDFECAPGPNRGDPEEAEREESYDVSCKEIPER